MLDLEGENNNIKELAIAVADQFNYSPITYDLPQRVHNFIKTIFKKQYGMFNNICVEVNASYKRRSLWFEYLFGDWPNLRTVRTVIGTNGIIIRERRIGRYRKCKGK